MTLLKICGITRIEDAHMALKYADYIGVIAAARVKTPRLVSKERAREILQIAGRKGVLVVEGIAIEDALRLAFDLEAHILQYHGPIDVSDLDKAENFGIKIAPVLTYDKADYALTLVRHDNVEYVLIDAPKGHNTTFEYGLKIPLSVLERLGGVERIGFAGGINPDNARMVMRHRPWLIDVSSGVESSPGVKDETLVRRLWEVVKGGP